MYKIKLFRNMSGLVAGQSLKQMLTNRDWWKGVFGNMVSTMLGIALTVGVAALVEHNNDKKLSREMMFHVLMTTENNLDGLELTDSIVSLQIQAGNKWIEWYMQTDGNLASIPDSVPLDTLNKYAENAFICVYLGFTRSKTENYFYSPQMMHQFGNPQLYADFALFVQKDQETFEKIKGFSEQALKMFRKYRSYGILNHGKKHNGLVGLGEIIKSGEYIDFISNVGTFGSKETIQYYKNTVKKLLKEMGATQEEYDEYKKEHNEELNNDDADEEDAKQDKQSDSKAKQSDSKAKQADTKAKQADTKAKKADKK